MRRIWQDEETWSSTWGVTERAGTGKFGYATTRVSNQLAVIIRNFSIHNVRAAPRILMTRVRRSAGNKASRLDWVMSMIKPSGYYFDRIYAKFMQSIRAFLFYTHLIFPRNSRKIFSLWNATIKSVYVSRACVNYRSFRYFFSLCMSCVI